MVLGIYRRVSTDEQLQHGISLEAQVSKGKECALQLGWKYKVFGDPGISGSIAFNKRPGLNSLLDECISGNINGIFVTDLDRLSRDMVNTLAIKDLLKKSNTKLFDIKGEIDLLDVNQDMLMDLRTLLSAYELKKTSARIKVVLEENVRKGKTSGGPLLPFGYSKDENKLLTIDKKESQIVKLIFKLALEGNGTKSIATILNNDKIPTKRGNTISGGSMMVKGEKKNIFVWRDAVIYRILTNPIYKGERQYKNKTYTSPAIIDKGTFELVKNKLSTRNQFKDTNNKYEYLLKGLINCPICKGRFYGHKRQNGKDNAYVCNSKRNSGEFCGNQGINIDYLDKLVIDNIKVLDKITEKAFEEVVKENYYKSKKTDYDLFTKELYEIETKIKNLVDMVENAGIKPDIFKSRLIELNREKRLCLRTIANIENDMGIIKDKDKIIPFVKQVVKDFIKMKTIKEQKEIIVNLVSKITIRWNKEELKHMIGIFFRIDRLNQYLLSKEIEVNRTKQVNKKKVATIITEKITISNAIGFDSNDVSLIRYR